MKQDLFCTIDFETTGLKTDEDEVIEMGWVIHTHQKIIGMHNYLIKPSERISQEIEEITNITNDDLDQFGVSHMFAFTTFIADLYLSGLEFPKYFVGHRAREFDMLFFKRYIKNYFANCGDETQQHLQKPILDTEWICTMNDLPFPKSMKTRKLTHLSYEHGYYIQDAHRALFDCLGCFNLLKKYDIKQVIQMRDDPVVTVNARVKPPWEDKGFSKEWAGLAEFRGKKNADNTYTYSKQMRKSQFESLLENAPIGLEIQP